MKLRIEVPAAAVPGIGALGLALALPTVVCVEVGAEGGPVTGDEAICAAYRSFPAASVPGARFTVEQQGPIGVGLGEDVALTVAGLAAAAAALKAKDAQPQILQLTALSTRDPARASAAVLGGITAAFVEGDTVRAVPAVSHLALRLALFIPADTPSAPAPAPELTADVQADCGKLAYLISALIWGRWDLIGPALQDAPQPDRLSPSAGSVLAVARAAGAYAATSSGPTLIALVATEQAEAVVKAMETRARELAWPGRTLTAEMNEGGARVSEVKPEEDRAAQPSPGVQPSSTSR